MVRFLAEMRLWGVAAEPCLPGDVIIKMTLTHWDILALVGNQLGVINRVLQVCPNEDALRDLPAQLSRLEELVAAYLEAPKAQK
jgi:hypothetical protein